jgi:pimeloyl-ACP methyl ester carboxylesterase
MHLHLRTSRHHKTPLASVLLVLILSSFALLVPTSTATQMANHSKITSRPRATHTDNTPQASCAELWMEKIVDPLTGNDDRANLFMGPYVEGNKLLVEISYWNDCSEPTTGYIEIVDLDDKVVSNRSEKVTVYPRGNDRDTPTPTVKLILDTSDLYVPDYETMTRTRQVQPIFRHDDGRVSYFSEPGILMGVKPRPVVLVHGYRDTESTWDIYKTTFLPSMPNAFYSGKTKGYAIDFMNTGEHGPLSAAASIDENAQRLQRYIDYVKRTEGAAQVDIVAHSMGGLIARRYISKYMLPNKPDVDRLIMLGTPNAGSNSANALAWTGAYYPATYELTPEYVKNFNANNFNRFGVEFYAVAGKYSCLKRYSLPLYPSFDVLEYNPLEGHPNDIIVGRESVFSISLDGKWSYPQGNTSSCLGHHQGMLSDKEDAGGKDIFTNYVAPLLQRINVPIKPESESEMLQAPAASSFEQVQFTSVHTTTLLPKAEHAFTRTPEAGSNATFIVAGDPDSMEVSLRDPKGRIITPSTVDSAIHYTQMDASFLPMVTYTITNPVAGVWTTLVKATAKTPSTGTPIAVLNSVESDIRLELQSPSGPLMVGRPILVATRFRQGNTPILNAKVTGVLQGPGHSTLSITLVDNGKQGDAVAGDGIYTYQVFPHMLGTYTLGITAEATVGKNVIDRSTIWAAQLDGNQVQLPFVAK